jgi:hypothetical protein
VSLFGFAAADVLGRPLSLLYAAQDTAEGRPMRDLRAALLAGRHADTAVRATRDGRALLTHTALTAARDGAGDLCGFVGVAWPAEPQPQPQQPQQQAAVVSSQQAAAAASASTEQQQPQQPSETVAALLEQLRVLSVAACGVPGAGEPVQAHLLQAMASLQAAGQLLHAAQAQPPPMAAAAPQQDCAAAAAATGTG